MDTSVASFLGEWRVTSLSRPDLGSIPAPAARFTFADDGTGSFRIAAIEGQLRGRFMEAEDGTAFATFTWAGTEGLEPVRGRGHAVIDGDTLRGWVKVHRGDEASFVAARSRP